jgi:hypothetical protein
VSTDAGSLGIRHYISHPDMPKEVPMEELAGLLSRERLLLELLLFKLVTLRQLLTAGEVRFLPWASEEVDRATAKVAEAELNRSAAVEVLAAEQRISDPTARTTLRTLADSAPEPWRTILAEHRRAFLELARDIEEALAASKRLAGAGGAAVTATLDRLTGSAPSNGHVAQATADTATDPAARYGAAAPRQAGAPWAADDARAAWASAGDGARFSRTL